MTQAERDRLVALKKAKKKLITQKHYKEHEITVSKETLRDGWRKQSCGRPAGGWW